MGDKDEKVEEKVEKKVEVKVKKLTAFESERIASRQKEHEKNVAEYLAGGR